MKQFLVCGALMLGSMLPTQAATDWNAAAEVWRVQYRALALVEAARETCGLDVPKAVRRAMKEAREGLRDALAQLSIVEKPRSMVKTAGGKQAFCSNADIMSAVKAEVAAFSAQMKNDGDKAKLVPATPAASAISANAPTPVIDPNVALIRNCRKAVIVKLGKKAEKNDAFWPTYESCMKDQGVGWF